MYFHMYFYYGEEFRLNVHTDWLVEANCGGFLYKHTALVLVVAHGVARRVDGGSGDGEGQA